MKGLVEDVRQEWSI